jgi:TonB-linked SusC/RagA family outer membrane protein
MNRKLTLLVLSLLLLLSFGLSAQQAAMVNGVVTDDLGDLLTGVSVYVKGTSTGAVTDIDGKFSVPAATGETLVFSYIGYTPIEIKVKAEERNNMRVVLKESTEKLEEVVVTALGIKREQKALSYNVQKVDGDELTNVKDANFINSLNGKVAGVTINASATGAGGASRVIIRGTKSLTKDDNALYVIDGIPMFNVNSGTTTGGTMSKQPGSNSMADINPEDIESMSVLTGPSAAALYGSDAANGVILITTKKGIEGKTKITYSNSSSFSRPLMMPKFQNIYGNNEGESTSWGKLLSTASDYDPSDFFNTGVTEINSLTLSTGTEKNQSYLSLSSTNTGGILPNSDYNRYNFLFRNTARFYDNKLVLDLGAQYVIQNDKNMVGSGQYYNPLTSLYLFPRGEDFAEVQLFERYSETRNIMEQYWPSAIYGTELDMQNPYWIQNRMVRSNSKQRYMFNAGLTYNILPYLYVVGRVRVDNSNSDYYEKFHATTNATFTEGSSKGFYNHTKYNSRAVYGDVMASFNKNFVEDRLSINVQVGASINDTREDNMYMMGGLDKIPNFFHYGNISLNQQKHNESGWHDQVQSVFGSAEIGWNHQLYFTVTGRNDWASMLAFSNQQSYFYPSVGLSWLISSAFEMPEWLTYLKVRGSWAEVASSPSRYLTRMQYTYNEQNNEYVYPSTHYTEDLKPENTRSWEVGLNTKFFKNRFYFDATYYRSNTFNQTFYVDASASSGYSNNLIQTGNIQNQGVEIAAGYQQIFGKWRVSTGLTYSVNRNKIIQLANGATNPETGEPIEMDYLSKGTLGISGGPTLRLTEGGTMGDLYTNLRLRQSPNGYIWRDPSTGNVQLETADYKKVGSILPKGNLGWTGNFGYGGWNLNFAFTARFGGNVVSATQAVLDRYGVSEASAEARLSGGVSVSESMGLVDTQNYYETISSASGTYYIYDATNVRLSEISLSYQFPRSLMKGVADLSVGITGKNLWMLYCKAPFDPESTSSTTNNFYQGIDYFQQPSLRSFGFNVKLTF